MSPEYCQELHDREAPPNPAGQNPLLIGDALHLLNPKVSRAVAGRDEEVLLDLVGKQAAAGAQALAVNLGPGRKEGGAVSWVVETVRRQTDMPLFFSSTIICRKQLLREQGAKIVINAVTADREDMSNAMKTAGACGNSLVVLLVKSGRMTAAVDDKILLACDILECAEQNGLPFSRLYLDPLFTVRPDPGAWHLSRGMPDVDTTVATVSLLKQLDPAVKTILALGSGSAGLAKKQKTTLHCRVLPLLAGAGLDAVMLDCFDRQVMKTAEEIQGGVFYPQGGRGAEYRGASPGFI